MGSGDKKLARKTGKTVSKVDGEKIGERFKKSRSNKSEVEKTEKGSRKTKVDTPEATLRVGLDMCSKRGDIMGAIRLYELARKDEIKLSQYHYAVLLYLCSSAATGVVQPAKSGSGSGSRSLSPMDLSKENASVGSEDLSEMGEMAKRTYDRSELNIKEQKSVNGFPVEVALGDSSKSLSGKKDAKNYANGTVQLYPETLNGLVQLMKKNAAVSSNIKDDRDDQTGYEIQVSEDIKRLALQKGFEIHEEMQMEKVPMNEATFTSVARMAMSLGDGDMAFDMVKQMKEFGINPRLRSYGPALAVFCSKGDVDKAFMVEKHMLEHGVYPEEPELEALMKVSIEAGKSDKVYYLLHKLRTSVRQVSPATADLIEWWFKSKIATRVGKRKWDKELIIEAIKNGGGGWHGQGWLGKGKWTVFRTLVGSDGLCKCCGEKLVTIDLDPIETENFAKSVAAIAAQREKHSSFQKFQKWLDYYGPFEAVVDGANIGLYSQRRFKPSKVNAVVNGIRQMLPSKKWPLIVLHNRRITAEKMDEPLNRALIDKWKNADALYATPTGSNDDWYWLYAAIKFRCLIVTNDEMRDHLFQLLGNDFFPKWKERHQVHFRFSETGPVFHMPPPCSVVIQESENGHWHIPIVSEVEHEDQRTWLCITRANSSLAAGQDGESHISHSSTRKKIQVKLTAARHGNQDNGTLQEPQESGTNSKTILQSSTWGILPELEAAEKLGSYVIDFQI
ncbi:Proteinaceous RNase P 1 [Forsythia ovata]|uniref:ribonuclease P n=1 Tax=Forsythia ovata TaxID=205694 RepID=A0ABD1WZW3_9LAMI